MKKIVTFLFLLLICSFSLTIFAGCKREQSDKDLAYAEPALLELAVMTDLHYVSPELIGDYSYPSYSGRMSDAKTLELSAAIVSSAFDDVCQSGVKYLLIAGDLCDNHALLSHTELAALMKSVEDRGVSVFVVPGNHDVAQGEGYSGYSYNLEGKTRVKDFFSENGGDIESQFKNIYFDFGYKEAISVSGLSYSADLEDKYRLIAIDNCSKDLSDEDVEWVKSELSRAANDGRIPVGMMHKPLDNIFGQISSIATLATGGSFDAITANAGKLKKAMFDGDMKLIFTGHNHCNNSATITSKDGKEITDIMTVSLSQYGNGYRYMRFSENYTIGDMRRVSALNETYLPSYLSAADRSAVMADFGAYSRKRLSTFLNRVVNNAFDGLAGKISSAAFGDDSQTIAIEGYIERTAKTFLDMPLYERDGEGSLENYFKHNGGTFPESEFKNIREIALYALGKVVEGQKDFDETFKSVLLSSVDGIIAMMIDGGIYEVFEPLPNSSVGDRAAAVSMLIKEGKLELLNSRILNIITNFYALQQKPMLAGFLPEDGVLDSTEEFSTIAQLFPFAEAILDCDLDIYFEKNGEKYTGVFMLNSFLENELLGKLASSFYSDQDFPDSSFLITGNFS